MCTQQNRQKRNRYLDIWLPFMEYSDREHFLKIQPQLLNMSFKKTTIRLKSVNLQQKTGERLFQGRKQRLAWAVGGSGSTWLLSSAALDLCLSQLRLSAGRPVVEGTKPCFRSRSGVWKSEVMVKRWACFSKTHWEYHRLSACLFLKDPLEIPRWGFWAFSVLLSKGWGCWGLGNATFKIPSFFMCQISLTPSIWWHDLVLLWSSIESSRNIWIYYVDTYKNEEQLLKNKTFMAP